MLRCEADASEVLEWADWRRPAHSRASGRESRVTPRLPCGLHASRRVATASASPAGTAPTKRGVALPAYFDRPNSGGLFSDADDARQFFADSAGTSLRAGLSGRRIGSVRRHRNRRRGEPRLVRRAGELRTELRLGASTRWPTWTSVRSCGGSSNGCRRGGSDLRPPARTRRRQRPSVDGGVLDDVQEVFEPSPLAWIHHLHVLNGASKAPKFGDLDGPSPCREKLSAEL